MAVTIRVFACVYVHLGDLFLLYYDNFVLYNLQRSNLLITYTSRMWCTLFTPAVGGRTFLFYPVPQMDMILSIFVVVVEEIIE